MYGQFDKVALADLRLHLLVEALPFLIMNIARVRFSAHIDAVDILTSSSSWTCTAPMASTSLPGTILFLLYRIEQSIWYTKILDLGPTITQTDLL